MKKSLFLAASVLLSGCLSPWQRSQLEKERIKAELELAKLPVLEFSEAKDLKLRDARRGVTPLPNDLQTWLDAGIKAGWLGVGAMGVYKLSDKISSGSTTTNIINNGAAE